MANPQPTTHKPETAKPPKKAPRPTDPVLLAVARLSRIMDTVPPEKQKWVMDYLKLAYDKKPEMP